MQSHHNTRFLVAIGLALGLVLAVGGCGDDDFTDQDGGVDVGPVDATVVFDGEFVPDGSVMDASDDGFVAADVSSDVSSSDMFVASCPGSCRPDDGTCGAAGACVLRTAEPMCVSTAGRLALGSPCESVDQCMIGLACFAGPSGGVCGRVCCLEDPVCAEDEECGGLGQLVDGTDTPYGQCRLVRSCNVFASTCPEGEACYITPDAESTCLAEGLSDISEACGGVNDCVGGLQCVGAFESTCQRLCRIGVDDECGAAETCRATADLPEGAGLCSPMSSVRRRYR